MFTATRRILSSLVLASATVAAVGASPAAALTYPSVLPSQLHPGVLVNGVYSGSIDDGCVWDSFNKAKTVVGYGVSVAAPDKDPTIRNSQFVKTRPILQQWRSTTQTWSSVQIGSYTEKRTYDDIWTAFPGASFKVPWSTSGYFRVAMQVYWLKSDGTTEAATTRYGVIYRTVVPGSAYPGFSDTSNGWCSL